MLPSPYPHIPHHTLGDVCPFLDGLAELLQAAFVRFGEGASACGSEVHGVWLWWLVHSQDVGHLPGFHPIHIGGGEAKPNERFVEITPQPENGIETGGERLYCRRGEWAKGTSRQNIRISVGSLGSANSDGAPSRFSGSGLEPSVSKAWRSHGSDM